MMKVKEEKNDVDDLKRQILTRPGGADLFGIAELCIGLIEVRATMVNERDDLARKTGEEAFEWLVKTGDRLKKFEKKTWG